MKNYHIYFILMGLCAAALLCAIFQAVSLQKPNELAAAFLIEIPLGLVQLIAGVYLFVRKNAYPLWAQKGIGLYWVLTLIYFGILKALSFLPAMSYMVWLVMLGVLPWGIAGYQVWLVWKMAILRKRQLKKREFLQLS